MDLQAINAYAGKRRADGVRTVERPGRWMLFGRLGPMNITNQLDTGSDGVRFTLRRNSHGLGGKIYIGIHRNF